ncbi:MAG: phosphoribosylamine--glycine ligase, partial [Gaiellales bacterium]
MRVLLVGSGGREHALAWKLAQSPGLTVLHAAPGNPGIGRVATLHDVAVSELEAMTKLASRLAVDFVVVGPEAPLAA